MYLVDLCSPAGIDTVVDSLPAPVISIKGWSKRINAPGKFVFSIHRNHPAATDENLQMWRHIRLFRDPRNGDDELLPAWHGFIISKRQIGERIEVLCAGGLKIFTKRYTGPNAVFTGEGSADVFALLATTNSVDGPTGISEGQGGVTTTVDLSLRGVQILKVLEDFAAATGGEFESDDEAVLHFVPSLGSDKSGLIELIFDKTGESENNLIDFEIAEDGEPMVNKIIGTSTENGGMESEFIHPTSPDTYPILVERKAFNQANSQDMLDNLTEAYGLQKAFPVSDLQAQPVTASKKLNPLTGTREMSGLQYEDVSVGDLVLVTIVTPNRNTSVVKRIAELIVDVDDNLNEQLRFTFSEPGVYVTEQYLSETELPELKRRVQELEAAL